MNNPATREKGRDGSVAQQAWGGYRFADTATPVLPGLPVAFTHHTHLRRPMRASKVHHDGACRPPQLRECY